MAQTLALRGRSAWRRHPLCRAAYVALSSAAALAVAGCVTPPDTLPDRFQQAEARDWPERFDRSTSSRRSRTVSVDPSLLGRAEDQKIGRPYQINGIWYFPAREDHYRETGVASWYGPGFHGKSTANGERYDQYALTAAHTTLPLPSWVRVTNKENGRSLILRVNDRGPFAHNRILDVSKAAATQLGFLQEGTAMVRVEYLGPAKRAGQPQRTPRHVAAPAPATTPQGLYVQAGAFANPRGAARAVEELAHAGPAVLEKLPRSGEDWKRVLLGPWRAFEEAEAARAEAARAGYDDARVVRR